MKLLTLDIHAFGHDKNNYHKKQQLNKKTNPYLHLFIEWKRQHFQALRELLRKCLYVRKYFHETDFHSMYLNQYRKE